MATNMIQFPRPQEVEKKPVRRRNQYKDGRFCVRVTVVNPDGSRSQKPFYSRKSLSDAKAQAKAYKEKLEIGLTPDDIDMTVSQWIKKWLPGKLGNSRSSDETYTRFSVIISGAIGDMRVREVRKLHLDKIMQEAETKSKSYVAKLRMTLKSIFSEADINDLCEKNPALYVRAQKGTYKGHRMLEDWEINLLLDHWSVRRAGWWMMLMMLTGMRRGEACARLGGDYSPEASTLTIDSAAHIEGNKLVVGHTKTQAGMRVVPVFAPLSSILQDRAYSDDEFMLTNEGGGILTMTAFRRGWESCLLAFEKIVNKKSPDDQIPRELPDDWIKVRWSPHDLRYTYATILYDAGVDEKTAQLWMGHADSKLTRELYTQLSERQKAQSTASLENYMDDLKKQIASSTASTINEQI